MEYTIGRAKSVLVWIKRFSYEFDDPWVIKRIFETFVIPITEYGSQVWSPKYNIDIAKIESVQKQFLIYAFRKFDWYRNENFTLPSYKHRLLFFHMNTLEDRRKINQILFIMSLINGKIKSSKLLGELNIKVRNNEYKIRTRQRNNENRNRNHYLLNENVKDTENPFIVMKREFNECYHLIDFNQSLDLIKKNLKNYFALNFRSN